MLQSNQKIIRHKVGLLNLAEELGNVSKACQVMGLSRDTFYRYRDAVEEGGVEALLERTRRVPNPKNRVDLETEEVVVAYAVVDELGSNTRPMARSASVTNCASVACSCRPAGCAASGFATTWLTSRRG